MNYRLLGDRLYVVIGDSRMDTLHEEVWPAVGWIQEEQTSRGLLVEQVGHSESKLVTDVEASLESMAAGRPSVLFGPHRSMLRKTICIAEAACVAVVAVLQSAPWRAADVTDHAPRTVAQPDGTTETPMFRPDGRATGPSNSRRPIHGDATGWRLSLKRDGIADGRFTGPTRAPIQLCGVAHLSDNSRSPPNRRR